MSDRAFLSEFITEPLYLIKEENQVPKSYPETREEAPTQAEEPKAKVELNAIYTSGDNLKGCVILVNWENGEIAAEKELLLKIMGSVKRTENDVLIAHASKASKDQIEALLAEQNHKQVLDFGTGKLSMVQQSELYSPISQGVKKFLKAHTLSEIAQDVEKKKALWKALQEIFS